MLFPISDDDRGISGPCYVTFALVAINIAVYAYQLSSPSFTNGYSVIPAEITTGEDIVETITFQDGQKSIPIDYVAGPTPIYLTLLTAMFMHGSPGHIFSNMLFLWIFGDNVEHRFGPVRFLTFYLISGVAASFAQIVLDPDSVIPNLGASGAIAGILGVYVVLFPRNKVNVILFVFVLSVPAFVVIGLWGASQVFNTVGSVMGPKNTGGVAYMAHVGGFVAGLVVAGIVRMTMTQEPDSMIYRTYVRDESVKRLW